jgi:hypothetical protein
MPEHNKAGYWIKKLNLMPHPEGGYFGEVYRSTEILQSDALPDRYPSSRSFSTSIYYLLQKGDISAFHRIQSDEAWYFHDGDPLELFLIDAEGKLQRILLGTVEDAIPQVVIPRRLWFAARTTGNYSLLGCNVAPGFEFEDFEMADRDDLTVCYPHLQEIIKTFTIG